MLFDAHLLLVCLCVCLSVCVCMCACKNIRRCRRRRVRQQRAGDEKTAFKQNMPPLRTIQPGKRLDRQDERKPDATPMILCLV